MYSLLSIRVFHINFTSILWRISHIYTPHLVQNNSIVRDLEKEKKYWRRGERKKAPRVYSRTHITHIPLLRVLSRSVISPIVRREPRGRLLIGIKGIADWMKSMLPRWSEVLSARAFFVSFFVSYPPLCSSGNMTENDLILDWTCKIKNYIPHLSFWFVQA